MLKVVVPFFTYLAPGKTCSMSSQYMTFSPNISSQVISSMSCFPSTRKDWVATIVGAVDRQGCMDDSRSGRSESVSVEKKMEGEGFGVV